LYRATTKKGFSSLLDLEEDQELFAIEELKIKLEENEKKFRDYSYELLESLMPINKAFHKERFYTENIKLLKFYRENSELIEEREQILTSLSDIIKILNRTKPLIVQFFNRAKEDLVKAELESSREAPSGAQPAMAK